MAIQNPEIHPSATLAAAGAYTTTGAQKIEKQKQVALFCSYTRGAASGAVTIRIEYSFDGTNWFQTSLMSNAAVTTGSNSSTNIQRNDVVYTSTAAGAETFIIWLTDIDSLVKINAQEIRLQVAESGATGSPGTFRSFLRTNDDS